MIRRIWAILQKELVQTVRDRATLAILLALPLIQLTLFAYAIHMNIRHIPLVVADQSMDASSRDLVGALSTSDYFSVTASVPNAAEVTRSIDRGDARAGLVIPPGFAASLARGDGSVLLLVDGSDPFTTQSAYAAAVAIARQRSIALAMERIERVTASSALPGNLDLRVRILYNPDQKDLWFLIPGLVAMLLQTQTIMLTTLSVVREREVGTIEQILVTPIHPGELMAGKSLANGLFAMANLATILLIAIFWFKVPFSGDIGLFLALCVLYMLSGLALGLLISSVSQNQRQAQQLMMMILLVGLILGGFVFPRYAMPAVLQLVGNLFPLTHFIPIARGIMSKGVGLQVLWVQTLTLAAYGAVMAFFAARAFRQRLD